MGLAQAASLSKETVRVTIDGTPVLCSWVGLQECLTATFSWDSSSTLLYESISWFDFKKWNTYMLDVIKTVDPDNKITDKSSISYQLKKEISRTFDAKKCTTQSYFDWCNTCMTTSGSDQAACTLMYCMEPEVPYCKYDESLVKPVVTKPEICTLEYMPVCDKDGKKYGNQCMADAAWAQDVSQDYCVNSNDDLVNKNLLKRSFDNKLTMFNNWEKFMPMQDTTREQAAKIFVEFNKLYNPSRPMSRLLCPYADIEHLSNESKQYIQDACGRWFFQWYDNNTFRPWNTITQEEFKTVLRRVVKETEENLIDHVVVNKALLPSLERHALYKYIYQFYLLSQEK